MDKVLVFAKKLLKEKIDKNSVVIDATCGNGNDTLFLAKTSAKKVYSFDIQKIAIERTEKLLEENELLSKCKLILDSHANFDNYVEDEFQAVIFNLGYLPNANHDITTNGKITKLTIEKMLKRISVGGIIVVVIYWGHQNGILEKEILCSYFETLNQKNIEVLQYQFINQKNNAPFLVALEKVREF